MSAGGMTVRETKAKAVLGAVAGFFKRETVLGVALVLAAVSACFVPPGPGYMSYVDWDTLALLFGLMAVVKGFQGAGVFQFLGSRLLRRTGSTRTMLLVLVFLPFFFSMVITNDVSLITFVPFGLVVLRLAGQERLVIPLVVLQTLAANLGSMLTPMGNPQNLYLYTRYSLGFGELCGAMAPYVALSGLVLLGAALLQKATPIPPVEVPAQLGSPKRLALCCLGFVLCLLGLFSVVPPLAVAAVVLVFLLFADRSILRQVDYSLLLTFLAFFVFIGNLGSVPAFQNFLTSALSGHVELVSVLASQVISNVPAALLLSGFTEEALPLLIGVNLGGLGTLIASMASLISYKQINREYSRLRGRYLLSFTLWNLALLAVLLLLRLAFV